MSPRPLFVLLLLALAVLPGCMSRQERLAVMRQRMDPLVGDSKARVLSTIEPYTQCRPKPMSALRDRLAEEEMSVERYWCRFYYGEGLGGRFNAVNLLFHEGGLEAWRPDWEKLPPRPPPPPPLQARHIPFWGTRDQAYDAILRAFTFQGLKLDSIERGAGVVQTGYVGLGEDRRVRFVAMVQERIYLRPEVEVWVGRSWVEARSSRPTERGLFETLARAIAEGATPPAQVDGSR